MAGAAQPPLLNACGRAVLDLGDKSVAHHDFRHPSREFQDVVSHPVCRSRIGGNRCIRAIEYADGDEHIRAAIEKDSILQNPSISRINGTKPFCTRRASSSTAPRLTLYFLILTNMCLSLLSARDMRPAWQLAGLHDSTGKRPLDGPKEVSLPATWDVPVRAAARCCRVCLRNDALRPCQTPGLLFVLLHAGLQRSGLPRLPGTAAAHETPDPCDTPH